MKSKLIDIKNKIELQLLLRSREKLWKLGRNNV